MVTKEILEQAYKIRDKCNMLGVEIPEKIRAILWLDQFSKDEIIIGRGSSKLWFNEFLKYQYIINN